MPIMERAERQYRKKLLKRRLQELLPNNRGFSCTLIEEDWVVGAYLDFDLPDFLGELGPNGELMYGKDLAELLKEKQEYVFQVLKAEFGVEAILKAYNLTCPLPPMWMVAYENGRPARPLTEEEQEAWINAAPAQIRECARREMEQNRWASRYYRFVPDSEYEDECWKLKAFSGFNLRFHFHVPVDWANGEKKTITCPRCSPALVIPEDLNETCCEHCGRPLYSANADIPRRACCWCRLSRCAAGGAK